LPFIHEALFCLSFSDVPFIGLADHISHDKLNGAEIFIHQMGQTVAEDVFIGVVESDDNTAAGGDVIPSHVIQS
jgi:hypothetical protein